MVPIWDEHLRKVDPKMDTVWESFWVPLLDPFELHLGSILASIWAPIWGPLEPDLLHFGTVQAAFSDILGVSNNTTTQQTITQQHY